MLIYPGQHVMSDMRTPDWALNNGCLWKWWGTPFSDTGQSSFLHYIKIPVLVLSVYTPVSDTPISWTLVVLLNCWYMRHQNLQDTSQKNSCQYQGVSWAMLMGRFSAWIYRTSGHLVKLKGRNDIRRWAPDVCWLIFTHSTVNQHPSWIQKYWSYPMVN